MALSVMARLRLTALLLCLAPMQAMACGCLSPIDLSRFDEVARAYDSADGVFSAMVENAEPPDGVPPQALGNVMGRVRLRVLEVWKGPLQPGEQWEIYTRNHAILMNCAMEPAPGEALMVYHNGSERPDGISICTRSGPLFRAFADLPILERLADREPDKPLIRSDTPPHASADWLSEVLKDLFAAESFARAHAQR